MPLEIHDVIIYEDEDYILVNKPPGILTQPGQNGGNAISAFLENHTTQPVYILNRLDRPVSGVVTFAKSREAAEHFSRQLRALKVRKKYIAVVGGNTPSTEGTLEHFLMHNKKVNKSFICDESVPGAKKAILEYRLLGTTENYTLIEVKPETGRFHQIRAQLSGMGCPIKGDVKYGARRSNRDRSIHLHALEVEFDLMDGTYRLCVRAGTPKDSLWDATGEINPLILHDKIEKWKIKM